MKHEFRMGLRIAALALLPAAMSCSGDDPFSDRGAALEQQLNPSPKLQDFVIEAQNSVRMQTGSTLIGTGDVGARGPAGGVFLSGGVAIDIGTGIRLPSTTDLIADSVRLGTGASVGDVQTNRLVTGTGSTRGSLSGLVPLPALPAPAPVSPGTANLSVATGATVSTVPGRFANVSLGTAGKLRLASGTYEMSMLTLGTSARIEALGPVQIRVASRLSSSTAAFIGPAAGVALDARDIRLEVSGSNGTDGALGSSPKAATFGTGNQIKALVLVPNGTLALGTGTSATGAFLGRDVDVGTGASLTFQSGFSGTACAIASCNDGNSCTVDTCSASGICQYATAANGASCSDGNACTNGDACQAGVCGAGTPVTCVASDACHSAGSCNAVTGACSNPALPAGTSCGSGQVCDSGGACVALPAQVVINEVESNGGTPGDWIELYNAGSFAADVSGYRVLDNDDTHVYVIPPNTTIAPGAYLVVEEAALTFGLGGADSARLLNASGAPVDAYSWAAHATTTYGRCPNGSGAFVTTSTVTKGAANGCGGGGQGGAGGTGGAAGSGGAGGTGGAGTGGLGGGGTGGTGGTGGSTSTLVINEVESNMGTPGDWVELYNSGATSVNVSGWRFLDNDDTHVAYVIPAGTSVAPGAYLLLEEAAIGFGLGAADSARLFDASGATVATYSWTAHATTSYGRCPNGTGAFTTTTSVTKGAANDCSFAIRINEVESSSTTTPPSDFIELYNAGTTSVDLGGWVLKDNNDAQLYTFSAGTVLAPAGYIVVQEAALGFGLGGADSARLYDNFGALVDSYTWSAHSTTTYGRCPNGSGPFTTTVAPSGGAANECPAPPPWPGSPEVSVVDAPGAFPSNLSGLNYEPASSSSPAVLWAVRNDPATLYRLVWNGSIWTPDTLSGWSAGKTLRYPNGAGVPDSEGVTRAELSDGGIYVATERDNAASGISRLSILRFDLNQSGTDLLATHEWNLTSTLPVVGPNLGLEAITFVPDSYLVANSFFDEAANAPYNPSAYPNHGSGLFFVGVEGTGMVYAFALDHTNGTFQRIATVASGMAGVMALEFDRDTGRLWTYCDDTCGNIARLFAIDTNAASASFGDFVRIREYSRPAGLPNGNNEGIAFATEAECVAGLKPFFWSDDSATGGHALRAGSVQCGPL